MGSGGARARSGPAKDPNSLRTASSQSAGNWRTLPAGDWSGEVPDCPIPNASSDELDMWATYWRKPQAEVWFENGMAIEVALHVRSLIAAFAEDAPTNARTLVSQQMNSLLLTHKALSDAGIRIGVVEAVQSAPVSRRPSARERRLSVVPSVGA